MWLTRDIRDMSTGNLTALIRNEVPLVQVDHFASAHEIEQLKQALLGQARRTRSIKQVTRLGISQYAQGLCQSKENYFKSVPAVSKEFSQVFRDSFDPVSRLLENLSQCRFDAQVMEEPGLGKYAPCAGKLRNGFSPVHVDFAAQDSPGWCVGEADVQLAWNLYLEIPQTGGELFLWDKQWQPEDDQHQVSDIYYYDNTVIEYLDPLRVKPHAGQLLLLNSRNFHAVNEASDRLSIGGFISFFAPNNLRLWI